MSEKAFMVNNQMDKETPDSAYTEVMEKIACAATTSALAVPEPVLVAVSKTHDASAIEPFIQLGVRHFGENRVQEAEAKWPALKAAYPEVVLHGIGPLQSNKAAQAVALFDVIETIDREKIAKAVATEMEAQGKRPDCLIQVNIGEEPQKAGVVPTEVAAFYDFCQRELGLPIRGLMCIPPHDQPPAPYFALMRQYKDQLGVEVLSMGMSADYEEAIAFGATHVRVGTALFGERKA